MLPECWKLAPSINPIIRSRGTILYHPFEAETPKCREYKPWQLAIGVLLAPRFCSVLPAAMAHKHCRRGYTRAKRIGGVVAIAGSSEDILSRRDCSRKARGCEYVQQAFDKCLRSKRSSPMRGVEKGGREPIFESCNITAVPWYDESGNDLRY